jgi:hypothetical protein
MTTKNTEAADVERAIKILSYQFFKPTEFPDEAWAIDVLSRFAAAKEEAWHPILSEDDLPKVEGQYLWKQRGDGKYVIKQFHENRPLVWWCEDYSRWMPIPPYTEPQTGGKDD